MTEQPGDRSGRDAGAGGMRICVVLPDSYDPAMPARPEVIEIFGRILPSKGHRVTWILPSSSPDESTGRVHGADVLLIRREIASSLLGKARNTIRYYRDLVDLIETTSAGSPFDVVIVRNSTITFLLVHHRLRNRGHRMAFHYTFLKESYRRLQPVDPIFFYRFAEHVLSPPVLRRADLIISISDWMTEYLVGQGYPPERFFTLPMGIDQEKANLPARQEPFDWERDGARLVMYVGTLDGSRELEVLVRAAGQIATPDGGVRLVMVGGGSDRRRLEELAAELGLEGRVVFTGEVPYEDVPRYISRADVCVSPIPPKPEFVTSSPTKVFEYMLMGKPVVANREIPEQRVVLEETGAGVLVDFESSSFARGIEKILSDPAAAKECGRAGKEWVLANRTYARLASGLEARLQEMVKGERA